MTRLGAREHSKTHHSDRCLPPHEANLPPGRRRFKLAERCEDRALADFEIDEDDPRRSDVTALLERHLAFCNEHTPPENVYALDIDGLVAPEITVFTVRREGELLGVGALKELDASHAEIKSMHTAKEARGLGVGTAMVRHLVATAAARGYRRVSLETGSMDAFGPARALYAKAGFVPCGAFGDYPDSTTSSFMTLELAG